MIGVSLKIIESHDSNYDRVLVRRLEATKTVVDKLEKTQIGDANVNVVT